MGTLLLAILITIVIFLGLVILINLTDIKELNWKWEDIYEQFKEDASYGAYIITFIVIFILSWLITFSIVRSTVVEKYTELEDRVELSTLHGGKDKVFNLGRVKKNGVEFFSTYSKHKEKLEYSMSNTTVEYTSETPHVMTRKVYKKIKKSEKPFWFFSNEDKVKNKTGCGCSSTQYIIFVPDNFKYFYL